MRKFNENTWQIHTYIQTYICVKNLKTFPAKESRRFSSIIFTSFYSKFSGPQFPCNFSLPKCPVSTSQEQFFPVVCASNKMSRFSLFSVDSTVFFSFVDQAPTLYSNYESYVYSQQSIKKSNSIAQQYLAGQEFAAISPRLSSKLSESSWAPITKYHRLGGLNYRNLFSHSSGGWNPKIKLPVGLVFGENALLVLQTAAFSLLASRGLSLVPACSRGYGRWREGARVSFLVSLLVRR